MARISPSQNDSISAVVPKGWVASATEMDDYEMGIDNAISHCGSKCAYIKSLAAEPRGRDGVEAFATISQYFSAQRYLEKRVRLSAYLRTADVTAGAGLWLRVDSEAKIAVKLDNMKDRQIIGTTDWAEYHCVLDVPAGSTYISFGAFLSGRGQVWFDDFKFAIVGKDVSTTEHAGDVVGAGKTNEMPVNLNFEES